MKKLIIKMLYISYTIYKDIYTGVCGLRQRPIYRLSCTEKQEGERLTPYPVVVGSLVSSNDTTAGRVYIHPCTEKTPLLAEVLRVGSPQERVYIRTSQHRGGTHRKREPQGRTPRVYVRRRPCS